MVTMQEEDIVVALVRLSEQVPGQPRSLDTDGMKNSFYEELVVMMEVHKRLERFLQFDAQITSLPSLPAPSPLKLWVVFDDEDEQTYNARMALSEVGVGTLALMATLSAYTSCPWDDAKQLERRASEFVDKGRIASLFVKSSLPESYSRRHLKDPDEAATMLRPLRVRTF